MLLKHRKMQPDRQPVFRLLAATLIALLLHGSTAAWGAGARSANFSLPSQATHMGAGKSHSSSFAMESCLGHSPVGSSASSSFKLQSGCGAGYLTANDIDELLPPFEIMAVPAFSRPLTALLVLIAAMLMVAAPRVSRTKP
jgi:hypothetical protein